MAGRAGMSGAQIANVCNEAALHAARVGQKEVVYGDFEYAIDRVIAGIEKRGSVLCEQERRIVAYHEAGHVMYVVHLFKLFFFLLLFFCTPVRCIFC